jgi:hypothetical protein
MDYNDGPSRPSAGPLFKDPAPKREPTITEAVIRLVRFVNESPLSDEVAEATRVVLRDFKAQGQVAIRLENIVHQFIKALEEGNPK